MSTVKVYDEVRAPTAAELRALIAGTSDARTKPIEIPEWGSPPLYLRTITGAERAKFEQSVEAGRKGSIRERFTALVLADESGNRVFSDSAEDAAILAEKSGAVLDRICDEGMRFNGIGKEAEAEALENLAEAAS